MDFGQKFFNAYVKDGEGLTIVDIGSQDVNGSLRSVAPKSSKYIGVDFVEGNGVDVIISDPYSLPFDENSVDVCVCSSCFEHSEFFWLLFTEILRILKPTGVFYLNVPSNGFFHRFPVDCWRFYPDSGMALQNWGRRSGYNVALLESFIGDQMPHEWEDFQGEWNDFVAVFLKDEQFVNSYPERIQDSHKNYKNGLVYGNAQFSNLCDLSQDQHASRTLNGLVSLVSKLPPYEV